MLKLLENSNRQKQPQGLSLLTIPYKYMKGLGVGRERNKKTFRILDLTVSSDKIYLFITLLHEVSGPWEHCGRGLWPQEPPSWAPGLSEPRSQPPGAQEAKKKVSPVQKRASPSQNNKSISFCPGPVSERSYPN